MTKTEQQETMLHPSNPRNAARIAYWLTRPDVTTGDIAKLRRLSSQRPAERIFWKVCLETGIDRAHPILLATWARIFRMIATGTKVGETYTIGPHDGNIPLGQALAQSGYSESRIRTLLDADTTALLIIGERMTGYLNSHEQKCNWNDVARLMLTDHRTSEERDVDRTRIARDYYRQLHIQDRQ